MTTLAECFLGQLSDAFVITNTAPSPPSKKRQRRRENLGRRRRGRGGHRTEASHSDSQSATHSPLSGRNQIIPETTSADIMSARAEWAAEQVRTSEKYAILAVATPSL